MTDPLSAFVMPGDHPANQFLVLFRQEIPPTVHTVELGRGVDLLTSLFDLLMALQSLDIPPKEVEAIRTLTNLR
ncbi:hypothetical protein HYV73_03950 [Candidatus Uhrbacteria bacterium]|nr:hypothetical protein [Candidatus Uhrbacteria bacterium]